MVSARTEALYSQRHRYVKRKVLKPGSLGDSVQTIARQMADAEFESMVRRYNDGLVSNSEMKAYLESSLKNKYFTDREKIEIEDKLRDFDLLVEGERLQTEFQRAEGQDQVAAAEALSTFYTNYANTLQTGTPAHSQALQNATTWQQKAVGVQESINKQDRKIKRLQEEYELSFLGEDTEDTLKQRAEAYNRLYQEAVQDGEQAEALQWATKINQIMNEKIPALQEKLQAESLSEYKGQITKAFQQITDAYHDGSASAEEAAAYVKQLDDKALEAGLYEFSSRINEFADQLKRDMEAGMERGDIEGLPYAIRISGKEYTATVKQLKEVFAKEDDVFRQMLASADKVAQVDQRLALRMEIYSAYLTGKNPAGEDVEEFLGLQQRANIYQDWHNQGYGDYTNEVRDTQSKIASREEELQKMVYQFSGVTGEAGTAMASAVTQNVLSDSSEFAPSPAGSQGIMITYDELGNEYEKVIPLNTTVQTTDPNTGQALVESTYVGRDVMQTPDGKYVKLNYSYSRPELAGQPEYADFGYAIYNGQYWVKERGSDELVPASQAAQTNKAVASWYPTIQQQELAMQERWNRIKGVQQQQVQPEIQPQGIAPQGMEVPAETFMAGQLKPEGQQPTFNYPETMPKGMGVGDYFNPWADVDLYKPMTLDYTPQNLSTSGTSTYMPEFTSGVNWVGQLPQTSLYNAGNIPTTPLQQSGYKYEPGLPTVDTSNLINTLPPVQDPNKKPKNILSQTWDFLKGLF